MKRRNFLKTTVPAVTLPLLLNGLPIKVLGKGSLFETALQNASQNDRVLVLINLQGGNDGLNTVIPLDQYANLTTARGNILIPDTKVLALNNSAITGLHPSLTGVQSLYNQQMATIIQGVSYPSPSYSHFRATDIWMTGSDSSTVLNTGWAGRYLNEEYPGYPTGYPNTTNPDPLAIQVGSIAATALQGPSISMGIAITSSSDFYNLVTGNYDPAPATPAGHELTFIRQTATQTNQYTAAIKAAALAQANLSTLYPTTSNTLADQLKIVAQLIGGGLKTKIYMVSMGGFDTHNSQTDSADTTIGQHAKLMGKLNAAIAAFQDDLHLMGKEDKVIAMTFSEFGRRIVSNASYGTDHGAAAPVLLFGSQLKGGLIGQNPTIAANVTDQDNLPMQNDFRSVYASILKGWFGVPDTELDNVVLATYPILDLFKAPVGVEELSSTNQDTLSNYPNPVQGLTMVKFKSTGGYLSMKLYDQTGREVETMVEGTYPEGSYQAEYNTSLLSSGIYLYVLQQNGQTTSQKMMVK